MWKMSMFYDDFILVMNKETHLARQIDIDDL